MKHKLTFILIATLIVTSFANAIDMNHIDCELSIQQIMENTDSCVREISGNKIYLKTDHISISEKGIHLMLNEAGDCAFIPELCTDETGCFIQLDLRSKVHYSAANNYKYVDSANNYKKTCSGCGWKYFVSCQNPNCPLNKK